MQISRATAFIGLILFAAGLSVLSAADVYDTKIFTELRWRDIGPFRGGRTRALSGVPTEPNVFYIAQVNGGIWKTNDYGHTWKPIFDHEDTGSVGAIAVAASDPKVIYAGSGEGLQRPDLSTGDGVYKSVDGGQNWKHLGLRDGQQIPQIAVDPRDPNRLFVAVLGHPYGPNKERGLYRSTDGGETFQQVFYKDENTGANDVKIDPEHPDVVYTSFWEARQGPWENAAWSGKNGGIFKSTDGGNHWQTLTNGLPPEGVVQANLAIAPSKSSRVFAAVATESGTGIYRSDDRGDNWTKITDDARPAARIGGGDLPVPVVDPKNPDTVYSASVVTWKSVDGGKTWSGIRGAPGGDDYQGIWINPTNPELMLAVSDQGAIVTVNGGETWTDWYNQPTAQMYHVAADNAFPYRVCSGQQESGSVCISTRGSDGEITFRDWHPVGVEEYGNAVPDPLDSDIVYGGKVTRYDRRTGQVQNVGPKPVREGDYRVVRTAPLVFSPRDPHTLYFASNTLWKTRNGGESWKQISPDLTRNTWQVPENVGKYRDAPSARPAQRGVIYAVSPSPLNIDMIWAGTDDGLVQVTSDGGAHWKDVTPPALTAWAKVSIIDASHFDQGTAYVAVNTFRLDDLRPHIYRTRDRGGSWTEIVNGIPDGAAINVVREDPKHKGLLFAGSERAVYVSFDDGEHWKSLRINMPATSVRDLLVKNDDLIAATHGRGFWILDDIEPLREFSDSIVKSQAHLFEPQTAMRVRWDTNTDTPLPPDVPAGKNPPDGAVIDYLLGKNATGEVTLEILDGSNQLVRKYSSSDPVPEIDPRLAIPSYWVRPSLRLSNEPGLHRFLWDIHYTPLPQKREEYPMQAVFKETAPATNSPWVMPGHYTVRLTAGKQTYTQPLTVEMDPRVRTASTDLAQQFTLSKQIYDDLLENTKTLEEIHAYRAHLQQQIKATRDSNSQQLVELDETAQALEGEAQGRGARRGVPGPDTLRSVSATLTALLQGLQEADVAPTSQVVAAVAERRAALAKLTQQWMALKARSQ
ncbi:MAG TPA: glycoside hydrolase [Bryobacteraceae bacterium]|nr:glycoside hydrolase [Bryobacteraceae bacterium]